MQQANVEGKPVIAWVLCDKCQERHLIRPGLEKPWWWCRDEMITLEEGQEIEYEEVRNENN